MGGFRPSNIGSRDTRITVMQQVNPEGAQGYYDEFGEEIVVTETSFSAWVEIVDKSSIGTIVGGKILDEVEQAFIIDYRTALPISISDTVITDIDSKRFQVVDKRDINYKFTTMIMIKRTG